MDKLTIDGIGEFIRGEQNLEREFCFCGQTIPLFVFPKNETPTPAWTASMRQMYEQFSMHHAKEIKRLPEFVKPLCREYEMYDGQAFPWSDEELLNSITWFNIKITDETYRRKEGELVRDRIVECCGDSDLENLANFTIIVGFEEGKKLSYAHFDG